MAKKKKNANEGGLTDMIYDMTGGESKSILIGLGVLIIIIIIIACLFYFNMLPNSDYILKLFGSSTDVTHNTPTAPTAPTPTFSSAFNKITSPKVDTLTTMPPTNVNNTSSISNQLTPPPRTKIIGGLRNSRMR